MPILDRTLDLLELLTRHSTGMTLTEMTETLGMPKNSVFRIATTLALRGYVERDEGTKKYRVSRQLLALGYAAIGGQRLVQAAAPILLALREETGETAILGTLAGNRGVVLDQEPSSFPVKVVIEIGHAFPLHTAAPAKAMLAFMNDNARQAILAQITFQRYTRRTLTTPVAFLRELRKVREQGHAVDRGEESETFHCVAAPVFDHHGQPVAAIWISGPADRLTIDGLDHSAIIVKRHAAQLSLQLGFQPPATS